MEHCMSFSHVFVDYSFQFLPVEFFPVSNSSLTECGDTVFSKGVAERAGVGVRARSADSRLDLPVVDAAVDCGGGVLQFLVNANA